MVRNGKLGKRKAEEKKETQRKERGKGAKGR